MKSHVLSALCVLFFYAGAGQAQDNKAATPPVTPTTSEGQSANLAVSVTPKAAPAAKSEVKKVKPEEIKPDDNRRYKRVYADIEIQHGDKDLGKIRIKLFNKDAPETVNNFVGLAEGTIQFTETNSKKGNVGDKVRRPYFDGLTFHRIVPGFVIQGGCPLGNGRGGPGYQFKDEFAAHLRHSKEGMVSMANAGPNTNGSQFFITLKETPFLDKKHAVFGEVIDGMSVVKEIAKVNVDMDDRPKVPVTMKKVTIVKEK